MIKEYGGSFLRVITAGCSALHTLKLFSFNMFSICALCHNDGNILCRENCGAEVRKGNRWTKKGKKRKNNFRKTKILIIQFIVVQSLF